MTEREILLNMLKRVTGAEDGETNFYWTEGNNVVITNDGDMPTIFEFDDKGKLVWYR